MCTVHPLQFPVSSTVINRSKHWQAVKSALEEDDTQYNAAAAAAAAADAADDSDNADADEYQQKQLQLKPWRMTMTMLILIKIMLVLLILQIFLIFKENIGKTFDQQTIFISNTKTSWNLSIS